ncbi:MAG TPA: class I SAM-dependent methyltransferase [Pseudolysinimonas sp.]
MAIVVGGAPDDFAARGDEQMRLLKHFGLAAGDSIVDVGCGSGRLALALSIEFGDELTYLGTDVVADLLHHARTVADPSYRFELNTELTVPVPDASCDFIVYFSVVTHLLHEESFRYLRDAVRALKPEGKLVVTFLESARHWSIFERVVDIYEVPGLHEPLVMFIERSMLEVWVDKLDLDIEQILSFDPPGQSIAVLRHRGV